MVITDLYGSLYRVWGFYGVYASISIKKRISIMILLLIIIFISGAASGIMDIIQFYDPFIDHPFWGRKGWHNKYKDGHPSLGPRFPGSTTIFVWITDGWHLCKAIHIHGILLSIVVMTTITVDANLIQYLCFYVILRLTYHLGFTITFNLSQWN